MRYEPHTSGKARKPLWEGRKILEAQAQQGLKCISYDKTPKCNPGTRKQQSSHNTAAYAAGNTHPSITLTAKSTYSKAYRGLRSLWAAPPC